MALNDEGETSTRLVAAVEQGGRFADFEGAVLREAGRQAGAEGVVTREAKGVAAASLPVHTSDELLRVLQPCARE